MNTLRLHQLNDIKLVGRLTQDPILHVTSKGQSVCRMNLAVNRSYKDALGEWKEETAYVPTVVWKEMAQRCSDSLKKGSPVYVEGRLKSSSWETKDGQRRKSLEVDIRRIQFLEKSQLQPLSETSELQTETGEEFQEGSQEKTLESELASF